MIVLFYPYCSVMAGRRKETLKEKCQRMAKAYQNMFKSVTPLSSEEFLTQFKPKETLLVDCRTKPEQDVSMIEGAITLQDLDLSSVSKETSIVTYCTIGYRSSLEAQRLQDESPQHNIYSLDGIVSLTHALEEAQQSTGPKLISPITKQQTKELHVFGGMWDVASDGYATTHFHVTEMVMRMLQVGGRSALRAIQHVAHQVHHPAKQEKQEEL